MHKDYEARFSESDSTKANFAALDDPQGKLNSIYCSEVAVTPRSQGELVCAQIQVFISSKWVIFKVSGSFGELH